MNALVATTLLLASLLAAAPVLAADALWAALRGGGHVALMRHATAPGVGDPEGFGRGLRYPAQPVCGGA
ncbi:hypothetical protein [Thauera humireducens]|uniref:hypothetical protein n=1 Tax=Thauera humireducens TaxID=1134435 RepID=UPI00311E0E0D